MGQTKSNFGETLYNNCSNLPPNNSNYNTQAAIQYNKAKAGLHDVGNLARSGSEHSSENKACVN